MRACISCRSNNGVRLATYKRHWYVCRDCGDAVSEQRGRYPLQWTGIADYYRKSNSDEQNMYDYFVEKPHIEWSIAEGRELVKRVFVPHAIECEDKDVLDISGGNGHAANHLTSLGANVTVSEINAKSIEYIRSIGLNSFEYNLNEHNLPSVAGKKFDIVLARACLMFAKDIRNFARQAQETTKDDGVLVIDRSVKPTLGVMIRTQLDEFSYYALRRPETVIRTFQEFGFELEHQADEIDQTLYMYDNDLTRRWMALHYLYEIQGARQLGGKDIFELRARDRRTNTFVFRYRG